MRASDLKPGQHFKLATDPRILKRLAFDQGVYAVDGDNNLVGVHPDSFCEPASSPNGDGALRFKITHHDPDKPRELTGRVEVSAHGLDIFFDGYGVHTMNPGYGSPVFIEPNDHGHPVVHCWAEIDCEDPTHNISLHGARDNRQPE